MFILEAGTNHLGKATEIRKIMNFYLNSSFKKITLCVRPKNGILKKSELIKILN